VPAPASAPPAEKQVQQESAPAEHPSADAQPPVENPPADAHPPAEHADVQDAHAAEGAPDAHAAEGAQDAHAAEDSSDVPAPPAGGDADALNAAERLNKRADPRKAAELVKLDGGDVSAQAAAAAAAGATLNGGGSGGGGGGGVPRLGDRLGGFAPAPASEDEYYGLANNPRDNVDPSAFQPSHIFAFEIEAGGSMEFFEDVGAENVRKVVRGDWFVTRCVVAASSLRFCEKSSHCFPQRARQRH
jgi:hypothetical protein